MKLFKCQHCDLMLFFENRACERCRKTLGYLPVENELSAMKQRDGGEWQPLATPGRAFRQCKNAALDACNWMIPAESAEAFCLACRHNRTVPDLSDTENLNDWRKMEFAKHRLFYTLLRLNLPLPNRNDDAKRGLAFDFLADVENAPEKVMTGHDEGLITLALKEANDATREERRAAMHEPYRTLLGHFRHEIGHYYWDRLIADKSTEAPYRAIFGDEREDYGDALKRHYEHGAPADWQERFISTYATSHPWEDFAETWAHYLHIVDGIDTAKAFGLQVHPTIAADEALHIYQAVNPYHARNAAELIEVWLPLTYAMNAMNRSLGQGDSYPFVLSPPVAAKLEYIHALVHAGTN